MEDIQNMFYQNIKKIMMNIILDHSQTMTPFQHKIWVSCESKLTILQYKISHYIILLVTLK